MATYTVTTNADSGTGSLRQAINDANANPGSTIVFSSSVFTGGAASVITLASALPEISANVTIDGASATGVTINGNHGYQGLFVYSGAVTIEDLTIENAKALGATGATGAGGAGGLGGGLFVGATAHVAITNVSFSGDSATGGAGGAGSTPQTSPTGGSSGRSGSSGSVGQHADGSNGGSGGVGGFGGQGGAGWFGRQCRFGQCRRGVSQRQCRRGGPERDLRWRRRQR